MGHRDFSFYISTKEDRYMDISTLIQNFGFPIACVIACGSFIYKMYTDSQATAKEREEKLYTEIAECIVVNKQALDTIAQYATKLDVIQEDVKEIKQKVGA